MANDCSPDGDPSTVVPAGTTTWPLASGVMMHSALSTLTVIIIITMRQTTVAAAAVIPYADIIAEIYGGVVGST